MKVGELILLGGHKFRLLKADEYSNKYMEANYEAFTENDIIKILEKIRLEGSSSPSIDEYSLNLIKSLDKNCDGWISYSDFYDGIRNHGIFLSPQEEYALMRKFDHNHDGKVSLEEFYHALIGK